MFWGKILAFIAAVILIFWVIYYIRANPQAFSKENLNKSFFVLGILALGLIILVVFLVMLVR